MSLGSKHRTLYTNIGKALSTWAMVEMGLSKLFATMSEIRDPQKAHGIFDVIISFETRVQVAGKLMSFMPIDEVEREIWHKLANRLLDQYKKRHPLAHFTLGIDRAETPHLSPFTTWDKILSGSRKQLTIKDIKERAARFVELQHALNWFSWTLMFRLSPLPPGSPQPDIEEPHLVARFRALAIQNLQERKARDQPPPKKG